jgi:hypothetical protein
VQHPTVEGGHDVKDAVVPFNPEPSPSEQGGRPLAADQGDKRVHPRSAAVGSEGFEVDGSREVEDEGFGPRLDGAGHVGDGAVRDSQDHGIGADGSRRQVVAPAADIDLPSGLGQCGREG